MVRMPSASLRVELPPPIRERLVADDDGALSLEVLNSAADDVMAMQLGVNPQACTPL
jgi:hypothetical protein